ncbi:MAG TPA: twin-arginine translocation signal domain-containing protein, partial [Isosphaeraceae bacterium]|nr:twin-arginine translocation signal domain-containing protein [Isosphaeraceae bacterium]
MLSLEQITRRQFHAAALAGGAAALLGRQPGAWAQEAKKEEPLYGPGVSLRGMRVFPADNPWNRDISQRPVDRLSARILKRIGLDMPLHPDFGTVWNGLPNGLPYVVVPGNQPKVPVKFRYTAESDRGLYPIPPDAPIEGGGNFKCDRHVLVVDRDHGMLYELFDARPVAGGKYWEAEGGAIFDLKSNRLRPEGWTSADAAGLPIF